MKTIVITGATSGIGKALLKYFLQNGEKVFAGYRNEKFVNELIESGAIPFFIDMNDKLSIENAANFIKSKTNKIDTLINCAGCVVAGVVEKLDVDRIRQQFEVNTFSHLQFFQNLINLLDNGKVINISSMASFGIFPFVAPYCASKRALDILFNSILNETKKNIKIISVKPGVIATPLWDKSVENNQVEVSKSENYEKEVRYMLNSAHKNGQCGLDVNKVVKLIAKIDRIDNPKLSYTVGFDAKMTEIFSHFPQGIMNKLIRLALKYKINNFS